MLVNMRELLADAMDGNYAVGSFSVANMEMVLGVLKAAEELKAPVILQIAEVRLKQSPLEVIGPLMVRRLRMHLPLWRCILTTAKHWKKSLRRLTSDSLP